MAATTSQVKAGLDDIATTIRNARASMSQAKARMTSAKNELASLPTTFATVIAQVDAYTPADAWETLQQTEKAKLAAEFTALQAAAAAAETALAAITEF